MAGWPNRHKRILCDAFNHHVNRLTRRARATQSSFQRISRHHRVSVEIAPAFAHSFFDVLEMLRRVTGLNIAPFGLGCFNFDDVLPQVVISSQRVDDNTITLRPLGMTKARIMLFKDGMMNYGSRI